MKRNSGKTALRFLGLGVLAIVASPFSLFSQPTLVRTGSFTLPFEAHWGALNLEPGAYSFFVSQDDASYVVSLDRDDQTDEAAGSRRFLFQRAGLTERASRARSRLDRTRARFVRPEVRRALATHVVLPFPAKPSTHTPAD